jgi:hypothetical protein
MRIFSYILAADDGAAPNPFWGYCTLAICKPVIRRVAQKDDWVVGIGPAGKPIHGKLIYAMKVEKPLPLDQYFRDPRFRKKKPAMASRDLRRRVGDTVNVDKYRCFPFASPSHKVDYFKLDHVRRWRKVNW